MKGKFNNMQVYSKLRNGFYNTEDVIPIKNWKQYTFYLSFDDSYDDLVDVYNNCGKTVFCFKRSDHIKKVFDLWCKKKELIENADCE